MSTYFGNIAECCDYIYIYTHTILKFFIISSVITSFPEKNMTGVKYSSDRHFNKTSKQIKIRSCQCSRKVGKQRMEVDEKPSFDSLKAIFEVDHLPKINI